jgi:beta-phosphoglucomutase-like phosphatase (HAD superfamily)
MLNFLSKYAGAIFDLDGTLTDSMHVWFHIARDWLVEGVSILLRSLPV